MLGTLLLSLSMAQAAPGPQFPVFLDVVTCRDGVLDPDDLGGQCAAGPRHLFRIDGDGTATACEVIDPFVVTTTGLVWTYARRQITLDWAPAGQDTLYLGRTVDGGAVGGMVTPSSSAYPLADHTATWSGVVSSLSSWQAAGCP